MTPSRSLSLRVLVLASVGAILSAAAVPTTSTVGLKVVPGTIALYEFDEGAGELASDSSGNGRDGLLVGNFAWIEGRSGTAVNFGSVAFTETPSLEVGNSWTIQGWTFFPLNPETPTWHTFARAGGGLHHVLAEKNVLGVYQNGFTPCLDAGGQQYDILNSVSYGWHLLSAVGQDSTTTFYIDAERVGVADAQVTDPITSLGNADGNDQAWGIIDSVRILDGARRAEDIARDANPAPPSVPTDLRQIDPGTALAVARGGILSLLSAQVRATISAPLGGSLTLNLEVRPVGQAFTNQATATSAAVNSGSVATVTLENLELNQGYHWQVQTVDAEGMESDWVSFGSHPDIPTETDFKTDGPGLPPEVANLRSLNAASGVRVNDAEGLRIAATIIDGRGLRSRLEVESARLGASFSGAPEISSEWTASGATASVALPLSAGTYGIRCRGVNTLGVASAWFTIPGLPVVEVQASGSSGPRGCGASSPGLSSAMSLVVLGLLLLAALRF